MFAEEEDEGDGEEDKGDQDGAVCSGLTGVRSLRLGHVSAEQGGKAEIKNGFLLCHRPFNGADKARQFTHQP